MEQDVSIIIPVYNAAETLERCVESIVYGQLRDLDIDIILIEDCSSDYSWKLCCRLSDRFPNVRCYKNAENRGVSYTRNYGLKQAKGNYVLFIDSDDWVSSKYITCLVDGIRKYSNSLVLCGLHFLDNVAGYRREYLWNDEVLSEIVIENEQFFDLADRFLLQQLWNKIFLREIIERYHICFDESQSMGEDFQFVLDYIEAAKIQKCVILNTPLYYYVRANNSSLMSKFGLVEHENEYRRFEKLKRICNSLSDKIEQQYQEAIQKIRYNYIYQICRSTAKTKTEKIRFIESIMHDGKEVLYYKQQRKLMTKEKFVCFTEKCRKFPFRVIGKLGRIKNSIIIKRAYKNLKTTDFSIISQNCIGGVLYHDMQMRFLSPTIDLFFSGADFVHFVKNLEYYINLEIKMYWEEEYPIGKLDDVTVYFMHYNTCSEAKEAWDRRKNRINWDKIFILSTDMESFDNSVWEEWCTITYPKILFTATKRQVRDEIYFAKYKKAGRVNDLIPGREFYKKGILIKGINQLA